MLLNQKQKLCFKSFIGNCTNVFHQFFFNIAITLTCFKLMQLKVQKEINEILFLWVQGSVKFVQ